MAREMTTGPIVAAAGTGMLFGAGLALSGMLDPKKVLDFLDLFGAWDPSLLFVMSGAVLVTAVGYAWLKRRDASPVFADGCQWPDRTEIDVKLIVGAALFGLGWGLVGLCPGPALTGWVFLGAPILWFVLAMVVGNFAAGFWLERGRE